jgi:very-short-patch-repair endonuclease
VRRSTWGCTSSPTSTRTLTTPAASSRRAFLALCRRHHLPTPIVNAPIGSVTVDFLWPDRGLIVELDGYRAHGGRAAFEEDRRRDVELRLQGYEVLRFTWRQIAERPAEAVAALRRLIP